MHTLRTPKPGQKGTRELLTQFGLSLLCVRYRYDDTRERLKTVELVVQRRSREREESTLDRGSSTVELGALRDGGCPAGRLPGEGPAAAANPPEVGGTPFRRVRYEGPDLPNRVVGGGGKIWEPGG